MRWITCKKEPTDGKKRTTAIRYRMNSHYEWRYCEGIFNPVDGWIIFPSVHPRFCRQWLDQDPPKRPRSGGAAVTHNRRETMNPRSPESSCWADISSAPHDRIILVAFRPLLDEPKVREAKWDDSNEQFTSVNRFLIYDSAFAWMPMPTRPTSTISGPKAPVY